MSFVQSPHERPKTAWQACAGLVEQDPFIDQEFPDQRMQRPLS